MPADQPISLSDEALTAAATRNAVDAYKYIERRAHGR
jgi:hypothetical protein